MKILLLTAILAITGCSVIKVPVPIIQNGQIKGFTHATTRSFATARKIKRLTIKYDGMEITIEGFESDQVEAFKAGVAAGEKAVKSAVLP